MLSFRYTSSGPESSSQSNAASRTSIAHNGLIHVQYASTEPVTEGTSDSKQSELSERLSDDGYDINLGDCSNIGNSGDNQAVDANISSSSDAKPLLSPVPPR